MSFPVDLPLRWAFFSGGSTWRGNDKDRWQILLRWSFHSVDAAPDDTSVPLPTILRNSLTMPTPTFTDGTGNPDQPWKPTENKSTWAKSLQLIINGKDQTIQRGKRFLWLDDGHDEPFGDHEATFAFPGITGFDDPADFGLRQLATVTLRRLDAGDVWHTEYEGEIASVEGDSGNGVEVQCTGTIFRLDLLKEAPPLNVKAVEPGNLIAHRFNDKRHRYSLNIGAMAVVPTGLPGIVPNGSFQPFVTGSIQDYLSKMQTDDGHQWTVQLDRPRTPVLRLKDVATVNATVSYGAPGVDCKGLSKDFTAATTAVFGSGSNGHCTWMGARFPNLVQQATPAYPGHVFIAGDGHGAFAPFAAFLRRGQYGTIESDDTYLASDVDSVEQFQDRAGITIDGHVGAQTWTAAFQAGANQGSVTGAYVDTVYESAHTRKHTYNAQGAEIGDNPLFDPAVPRIEDYIPFGNDVSKELGRKSAHQTVNREYPAGWSGEIILTSDPTECSRFDLKAGQNIKVKSLFGADVLLHITRRVREVSLAGSVTLTVDQKARDLLTAAAIYQRDKDVADLTRRPAFGRKKSLGFDDYGTWLCEDGAGEIPIMSQQAGLWNVQRVPAAPKGTIERIALCAATGLSEHSLNEVLSTHPILGVTVPKRFAVAIFSAPITPNQIAGLPGMATPLTDTGPGLNPWDVNSDALKERGMIYAAGGPGAACGFYPNNDPGDGSDTNLTGRFEDGGSVQFGPTGYYWLWVAVWSPASCKVGGRIFPGPPS